jgi:hypothetical protein
MKFSEMPYRRADIAGICAEFAEVTAKVPMAETAEEPEALTIFLHH